MIIMAAIKDHDGKVYAVPKPGRHHNVIKMMFNYGKDPKGCEQGFVTSTGEFLNRKEALVVAKECGQIKRLTGPEFGLFSEDVW